MYIEKKFATWFSKNAGAGGSKAVWIFSENSSDLVALPVPKVFIIDQATMAENILSVWVISLNLGFAKVMFMPPSKYRFSFDSSAVPCCDLNCDCPFVFFNFPTIKADHSGMLTTWHFEFIELCSRHSCSGLVSRAGAGWFVARSLLSCQTLFPQSI